MPLSIEPGHPGEILSDEGLVGSFSLVRFQAVAADIPVEERAVLAEWLDQINAGLTKLAA